MRQRCERCDTGSCCRTRGGISGLWPLIAVGIVALGIVAPGMGMWGEGLDSGVASASSERSGALAAIARVRAWNSHDLSTPEGAVLRGAGRVALRLGQTGLAVRLLSKAVVVDPVEPDGYRLLGDTCLELGDRACAALTFRALARMLDGPQPPG